MKESEQFIHANELFELIKEQLEEGQSVRFTVSGTSMMPWIVNQRDQVELISIRDQTLKKGDIILFKPFSGKYVLHRIIKISKKGYQTAGDGNLHKDVWIDKSCVIGKVNVIYRKGKKIDCNSIYWKMIFGCWRILFPFRKYLLEMLYFLGKRKRA